MGKYFSKDKWKYMLYTVSHPMDGYYSYAMQTEEACPRHPYGYPVCGKLLRKPSACQLRGK